MAYADGNHSETTQSDASSPAETAAPSLAQCGLAAAINLVGDRWTLLIIRSVLYGVTRFDHMQAELGLPRTVLSSRLRKLVDNGLLCRRPYKKAGQRTRHQYVLTSKGMDLALPLIALMQWGEKYLCETPPAAGIYERKKGAPLHAGLISEDGRPVELRDAHFRLAG